MSLFLSKMTIEAIIHEKTTGCTGTDDSFERAGESVNNMRVGWNLSKLLDSCGDWIDKSNPGNFKTAWGNPVITKELINAVKQSGFGAVSVPITWREHIDSDSCTIGKEWLERVTEVIDYVLGEDMYCIINLHHDTGGDGWVRAQSDSYDNYSGQYVEVWRQIA